MLVRVCRICKIEKPISEFHRRADGGTGGFRTKCKNCSNTYNGQYRKEHIEQVVATKKRWRQTHLKQSAEYSKRYYKKHPDKEASRRKRYNRTHKDKRIEWDKRYASKYPERIIIRLSPRYMKWRSDIFKRDNWTCKTCNSKDKKLHAHHSKVKFTKLLKEYSIKTYEQALKCDELWDLNNGVTLCTDCHKLAHMSRGL